MQFIDLSAQLADIRQAIDKRISTVLDHGQFIMGPEVAELEQKLAKYVGVKHCIGCANGTDALQLSLMANDIGTGDVVFTTAFSFFATAEVIPLTGAIPFFVDIDPHTYNICPESLEKAILEAHKRYPEKPKAVIAVDMFGLPANYHDIEAICHKYNLILIEDAAQGFGGSIENRKNGSFGNIATTSFFPAKPLGCFGDGGAIFTDSDFLAERCRSLAVHGKGEHKYENERVGVNSRLDTMQAAILLEKLAIFEKELERKQYVAEAYSRSLANHVAPPMIPKGFTSAWAQYTLLTPAESRQHIQQTLRDKGIPTAVYYPKALNQQPAMLGSESVPTPNTEKACQGVLSLPMHAYLQEEEIDMICEAVINALD